MATSFDRSVALDRPGSKLRVRLDVLSQNRSANQSHVRVRIEAYNGGNSTTFNKYPGAIVRVSGHGINYDDRVTFSIPGGSWFTFYDQNHTIGHAANGRRHLNLTGSMTDPRTNNLGDGGSITLTGSLDPLYLRPTTPSWGSTSYTGTERVRAAWNNRSSARGRYNKIRVQRWARSTGKWYHRALLSGSATSYTDTDLSPNNEHRWRVRAEGNGGNSGWVQGGTLGTTPATPTGVKAVKSGQATKVSWTDRAGTTNRDRTFTINDNPGGAGWTDVGEIGGSATSWTHTDADPAVTHQYRVWAHIYWTGINLVSEASDPSNTVQLQAAPDQPRREAPLDGSVQTVGVPFTLEWLHRPVDTTEQTAAEVQWRLDGGAWTTETVTGPEQALEVDPTLPGARAQFEWRVRTRGAHPDWSPWSTINGPLISTPPVIAIQSPTNGEALATSRVTASWTYTPGGTETQLAQEEWKASLSLWDSGTLIEKRSGTTAEQVALGTRLENGIEYAVTVAVRNGDGLWSSGETAQFSTNFPVPAEVTVEPLWDRETAAVSVGFRESEELRAFYRWTGEAGASTSEQYMDDPAEAVDLTDMIVNGDLADGQNGWTGTSSYERVTVNGPTGAGLGAALVNTSAEFSSGSPYSAGAVPVAAGQEYIFEMWHRADKPGSTSYVELRSDELAGGHAIESGTIEAGGSGSTGRYLMFSHEVPTDWALYRVRFTTKTGVGTARLASLYTNHSSGTEQTARVWRTGFRLYPASAADDGVAATNLIEYPMGVSATDDSGWESRFDDPLAFLQEDGEPALRVTSGARDTTYAEPMRFTKDYPVGAVYTFTVEVKVDQPLSNVRAESIATAGAVDNLGANDGPQEPGDGWVKRWGVYRVTNAGTVRVMAWPESMAPGESFMVRRAAIFPGDQRERAYFDGDTPGVTDVDAIDVERRQPDGSWLLIASGIDTSTTITDRTPHIGDVEYRAISRTTLPTETEGPAATAAWAHDRDPVYVNGGDGMGQQCLARGADATDAHAVDQALHRFAGQERPVAFFGTGQEHKTSFTGKILPHYPWPVSDRAEWVALLRQRGLVCFRDCTGRKVYGVLAVSFTQTRNVQTVSLEVEEAQYVEGVPRVSDLELEARMGEEA